jgi:hypothetical protein
MQDVCFNDIKKLINIKWLFINLKENEYGREAVIDSFILHDKCVKFDTVILKFCELSLLQEDGPYATYPSIFTYKKV